MPALAALAGWLFCYSMVTINGITLRQELAPDRLQGRVNTTARMLGWGGYPLGALIGGVLAELLPIRVTRGATMGAMSPESRPTLDGIEDKWMRRWEEGRVVQV